MKMIDISWPISEHMTAYKDKKVVVVSHTKIFERDHARESVVTLGSHSGTHVDAPSHFLAEGSAIDALDVTKIIGKAQVVDCTAVEEKITENVLRGEKIEQSTIVLLKTKNSLLSENASFKRDFVYLDDSGARYLVSLGVRVVGIDYLGIERNQPGHETHQCLLGRGIPIIEGLRLDGVAAGMYFLICLPLAYQGLEAAPARAVLVSYDKLQRMLT